MIERILIFWKTLCVSERIVVILSTLWTLAFAVRGVIPV